MATYVLVHGAWGGGWQWKAIAQIMQAAGHDIYRATLTGLGERVHLASPEVSMETHLLDVLNIFEYERLSDVILVGYSYGGVVVTGIAEHIPERIKRLVYVDAFIPQDGQSFGDMLGAEAQVASATAAQAHNGWSIPYDPPGTDRRTPQPIRPAIYTFSLKNPQAAALPRAFLFCTQGSPDPAFHHVLAPVRAAAQCAKANPNWIYGEVAAEHGTFWETHPQEAAQFLMELA